MKKLIKKSIMVLAMVLGFANSIYAQKYGGGVETTELPGMGTVYLNLAYMETPTLFVRIKSQEGWCIDPDFADYAREFIGMLPKDAYGPQGVNMTFYILGHLEEKGQMTFKEFIKNDKESYKKNGVNPEYKEIKFKFSDNKFKNKLLDYGVCEIYGLPNSKVEMMFIGKTKKGLIVIFFAAKGNPDDVKVEKMKKDFLASLETLEIYTRDDFNEDWK